jgi:hypothetical protein
MSTQTASTASSFLLFVLISASAVAAEWSKETVFQGAVRPSIAVGSDNLPRIAFLLEGQAGFIRFAEKRGGQWVTEPVAWGHFYGPLDILVAGDRPIISYYNHDAGDQMIASRGGGAWSIERIYHPGHDGWDNIVAIDIIGILHTMTLDPADFGGPGLEYTTLIDGDWDIEVVGTGPLAYGEGHSLTYDESNQAHISYHNTNERSLYHGVRESSGWRLSRVDSGPQAGMFSSIEIKEGSPIISYVRFVETGSAEIRLASFTNGQWSFETIDILDDLTTGVEFARNATSLELDPAGNPYVAYSGESTIKFAYKLGDSWQIEVVDTIDDNAAYRFGEQVDLVRDNDGNWHLVSFDVTGSNPLIGHILYYYRATP